jgi:tRNA threonylcarbamoyladenosine biosynthesis protein TsaE
LIINIISNIKNKLGSVEMLKKFKVKENLIKKAISEILAMVNSTDAIFLLEGNLASGKTTFVKEFVNYCGIDDEVSSPTYTIQNIYGAKIYHYDIYQKGINEFIKLGLLDMFAESGYHLIEWGNEDLAKILKMYGFQFWQIKIINNNSDYRIYQVSDAWQH